MGEKKDLPNKIANNKLIVLLVVGVIFITAIYFYRSSLSENIKYKLAGKRTTIEAIQTIESDVKKRLPINFNEFKELTLIALKDEKKLEVWGKKDSWQLIKTYDFTAFSGKLGPKLKEGDRQIPEGIYRAEGLNPNSSYHLSIKVNYPNEFDRKIASQQARTNLGGDIFIHGKAVTIGCIPIGDTAIEELFYTVYSVGKDKTKIIIAPIDLRKRKIEELKIEYLWQTDLYSNISNELSHYKTSS
ncbi:MAG: L,D-transpeptidase family protein [Acidobacteria bacterium]|nr:L,D-transpeptidase family protein [Acidobacteriota bacterium]